MTRCKAVGAMNVVVGPNRSSAATATGRVEPGQHHDAATSQQRGAGEADRDRVVHGRAHQMRVGGVESPQVGLVLEQRPGLVLVEHTRPHPLGATGRPRRVVHGPHQRIGRQIGVGARQERAAARRIGHHQGRVGVGDERRRARPPSSVALSRTGTTPRRAAARTHTRRLADDGRQNSHAVARSDADMVERTRHPALRILGWPGLERLDPVRRSRARSGSQRRASPRS